ncbi:MAG TPA: hypothetical protein EYH55_02465 [Methanothermococcus okinawensis]|uniref:dolichyl-phosphooligosaccharide-protein glycotransferase n=1 Tax=Methanothermococcus okinawensis TaxID=155863 RepID=A0A832ZY80_9EURY|nr:hypothetical protein [Methanothermococcus okinawensis]
MREVLEKIQGFFERYKHLKLLLILLLIGLISFQLRAQPADMGFTDNELLKKVFSDENGRMYLVAIDPYYYLRLTENYYRHGHLGETLKYIDGKWVPYDTCQYAPPGHPITRPVPAITYATIAVYNIWHSLDPTVTLMNAAFWVPPLLSILLGIPVFFIIRRVTRSNIAGIVGALIMISTPALLYKTSAGFADTPIFEILPILFIVWFIMEALHNQRDLKSSLLYTILATLTMALAPRMWAGWWYGYYVVAVFLILYLLYTLVISRYRDKIPLPLQVEDVKTLLPIAAIFILGSALLISLLYGVNVFMEGILSPFEFIRIKEVTKVTGWPNVYTTVAELQTPSLEEIVNGALGNPFLFILGVLGILTSFISMRYEREGIRIDLKYALLLTIWLVATFYAATKGVRFIGLMVPPLCIGIGILVGQLINLIKRREDELIEWILYPTVVILFLFTLYKTFPKIPKIILPTTYVPVVAYGFLLVLLVLAFYKTVDIVLSSNRVKEVMAILLALSLVLPSLASAVPFYTVPTFNNGWKEGLDWIKYETPNNTVITCWWDNGHIYAWATRKMVTFDGGSQNSPRAYWVGRAFATSNENLSVGIIRMLATSGDKAFERRGILMNYTHNNVSKTVKILNEILPLSRSEAYRILTERYHLSERDARTLLNYTHPEDPNPDYLITYNRMTDIAPVWSMFGFWDFDLPPETPNYEREKGFYVRLPGGDGLYVNRSLVVRVPIEVSDNYMVVNFIVVKNNTLYSSDVVYDLNRNVVIDERTTGFHKVVVKEGDRLYQRVFNENGTYSLIVRLEPVNNETYMAYAWISTRNLEDSVYTKLHFLDASGLKHIKLVKASWDPTSPGVQPGFKIYKVDYGKDYLN